MSMEKYVPHSVRIVGIFIWRIIQLCPLPVFIWTGSELQCIFRGLDECYEHVYEWLTQRSPT